MNYIVQLGDNNIDTSQGFIKKFFLGGGKVCGSRLYKIIPSPAGGLGGLVSPPIGSMGEASGSQKQ